MRCQKAVLLCFLFLCICTLCKDLCCSKCSLLLPMPVEVLLPMILDDVVSKFLVNFCAGEISRWIMLDSAFAARWKFILVNG